MRRRTSSFDEQGDTQETEVIETAHILRSQEDEHRNLMLSEQIEDERPIVPSQEEEYEDPDMTGQIQKWLPSDDMESFSMSSGEEMQYKKEGEALQLLISEARSIGYPPETSYKRKLGEIFFFSACRVYVYTDWIMTLKF